MLAHKQPQRLELVAQVKVPLACYWIKVVSVLASGPSAIGLKSYLYWPKVQLPAPRPSDRVVYCSSCFSCRRPRQGDKWCMPVGMLSMQAHGKEGLWVGSSGGSSA